MSSPKLVFSQHNTSRRQFLKHLGLAGFVAPVLSACAFQPLYGPSADGSYVSEALKSVDIAPIPGRVGQRLRNELIFKTKRGGHGEEPLYRLEVAVRESVNSILVKITGDAKGQIYVLDTSFKLVALKDKKILFEGKAKSRAAFDKFDSIFANTRARIDAENRTARTIAETINTRIATFLSRMA